MGCVYCFQVASLDCFKIGRTKNAPSARIKGVSVGSPYKLTIYREIPTDHAIQLEKYLHNMLAPLRAENGEFFNITKQQLDKAIEEAQLFLAESLPVLQKAKEFERQKTMAHMLEPTEEVFLIKRKLKEALRQSYILERQVEVLQGQLQIAIGENLGIKGVASWKWREQWKLNQALFKKEEPKLFEKYCKLSSSRVFRLE